MSDVWERIGSELTPMIRRQEGLNSEALWIEYTSDGVISHPSAALVRLLGWSPEGESTLDIIHPDDLTATIDAWKRLAEGNPVRDGFANRYRAADGSYLWLVWSPPLTPPGETGLASCVHVSGSSILYPALAAEANKRASR